MDKLIKQVEEKHKEDFDCQGNSVLDDCFTEEDGSLVLQFDSKDEDTDSFE